jgi:copper transport protein
MMVRGWLRWVIAAFLVALALLGALTLGTPVALAHSASPSRPTAPLHALLVRSDPAANAILAAPPSQVKAWFSEPVNPNTSSLVVIDPANHEVDSRDSHVSSSDPTEMIVGLQLLRPGAYIVVWRTQSAVDGHVASSSFIFRVANADGSVPPVPARLPTSATPGAAGYGSTSGALDGPTLAQALFDWLALLFMTFWVGGVIWEAWVAPVGVAFGGGDEGARLATRRFRRLAPYALGGLLLADAGFAAALTVEIAGGARGLIEWRFWSAALLSGQFAAYWWMRQIIALAALLLTTLTPQPLLPAGEREMESVVTPGTWTRELVATLRQVPRLPRRLLGGWLALPLVGQIELALGGLLLFAFAMSGHAAATPPNERAYAVTVDFLHLLFNAAWLGGLLYISVILVPAARGLSPRARALALARGVPAFSALAIVSAAFLTLTGSLNATVRLTSAAQLITTAYGRTLTVKVEIFLVMVVISAYHAFHLRPRLAAALTEEKRAAMVVSATPTASPNPLSIEERGNEDDAPLTRPARALAARMEDWLRREALLGVGVLVCVALLSAFSGTLASAQAPIVTSSAFAQSHTISGYQVALQVTPASFGSNTFTVSVTDPQGKPANSAAVLLLTDSLDMYMGEQSFQLKPAGVSQPGVYTGTGDLTMAGRWQITVKVLPRGASDYLTTQFILLAGS